MRYDRTGGSESGGDSSSEVNKTGSDDRKEDADLFLSITPENERELIELARAASQRQANLQRNSIKSRSSLDTAMDLPQNSPVLDPDDDNFSLHKWLRYMVLAAQNKGLRQPRAGVMFRNLGVYGSGSTLQFQHTVASSILAPFRSIRSGGTSYGQRPILQNMHGNIDGGELLLVLGRPGSGCSTLLKTITGATQGLNISEESFLDYKGVSPKTMNKHFEGEVLYNQEVDRHFPHLTVGQTLEMAASYRAPAEPWNGMSRDEWASYVTKVTMRVFGLSHTYNTKVGNDFIRGVSGGERKRVSIAEMAVAGSYLAAWDNSTRGLDSATALEFVKALKTYATLANTAHVAALYQASQAIYDLFDKVTVLYEGKQIFFGSTTRAQRFFEEMGWDCPPRQTTADFLTSVTNPIERKPRKGMEDHVPRTAEDFKKYWESSEDFKALCRGIEEDSKAATDSTLADLEASKHSRQAEHTDPSSPYMIPVTTQVLINTKRAYLRVWQDKASTVTTIIAQVVQALLVGSMFYNTEDATQGFRGKAAVLNFAVVLNAMVAIAEIQSLYSQRPVIEKHKSYAFYRPFTEALAGIVADIPVKFVISVVFNIILYFLANLRREPAQFFIYFLVSYLITMVMTALFRFIAASTKTISSALAMAGVTFLIIIAYTGFSLPVPYMTDWFSWLHWLNPVFYSYEMVVANEFHGRNFTCSDVVPAYDNLQGTGFVCNTPGAVPGRWTVSGDDYISASYEYSYSHVWRNFGILCAFLIVLMVAYFAATELNSSTSSKAEALVFRRKRLPGHLMPANDLESLDGPPQPPAIVEHDESYIPAQTSIFAWKDLTYDIQIKQEQRRLLDHVSGWVKPGTLTALMGASGAGKTTLLDVLAQRVSIGVVSGSTMVDGRPLDPSFRRKTGYVQQQDLHLDTPTVRESLRFSAMLRQPKTVPIKEKYDYVENVIKTLGMESFADAVVGQPGEGLNVEQRKRLTIGVELAAKPDLLLFLDEPTSGLDSQSSWDIGALLRKLASGGQAVLCTIHQPSAVLFQLFDRLLFLAPGGRTVYFGEIGNNSETMLKYFEGNGARKCDPKENPAEYMLEMVGAGANGSAANDWPEVWKHSPERLAIQAELSDLLQEPKESGMDPSDTASQTEFAMPFSSQLYHVAHRVFQQYWRTPSYVWSKIALSTLSGLFIGFTFYKADHSIQGTESVIFSAFTVSTILATLAQQVFPMFVSQRALYEVRERPSNAYSWKAFLIANTIVEIPYQVLIGIIVHATFFYAINGIQSSGNQLTILLFCIQFFIYASSFAHLVIAAMPDAESASHISVLLFSFTLAFNGVMQPPDALPGFWTFMWRISPLTYWIAGVVGTVTHDREIECSSSELAVFDPPSSQTCLEYLTPYLQQNPGQLVNPNDTANCQYCSFTYADQYVSSFKVEWSDRWRNFGIVWAYVGFNIAMATILYYTFRVKKWRRG
ncbi:ABC transporter-like protein [Neofusicoccum parvum]|uniref:ABC transporter-like protein n=1 Tax=Neofusicoccum parvum TaxID=310453 RepID=A0ACB5SBZ0_9PEZI|nr:ABC transporter-like protein [Neofusicoccum parvum]